MNIVKWMRNTLRNKFRASAMGKIIHHFSSPSSPASVCFVAATRMPESRFWHESPLGISLKPLLASPNISADIKFNNTEGLPRIYNNAIKKDAGAEILVFLHDDVWLDDTQLLEKIRFATHRFDVIGVAGNTRISKNQPAWLFLSMDENHQFIWDIDHLSGGIGHGAPATAKVSVYGPSPAKCELLDGVLLAGKREILLSSRAFFDERFKFHFYDMDFCRSARRVGLTLGTWPLNIIHSSKGFFGTPDWHAGHVIYKKKWKS